MARKRLSASPALSRSELGRPRRAYEVLATHAPLRGVFMDPSRPQMHLSDCCHTTLFVSGAIKTPTVAAVSLSAWFSESDRSAVGAKQGCIHGHRGHPRARRSRRRDEASDRVRAVDAPPLTRGFASPGLNPRPDRPSRQRNRRPRNEVTQTGQVQCCAASDARGTQPAARAEWCLDGAPAVSGATSLSTIYAHRDAVLLLARRSCLAIGAAVAPLHQDQPLDRRALRLPSKRLARNVAGATR
jgi:hypothetical protein